MAIGVLLANLSSAGAAPRFLARSWQSEDGLPSNIVHAIAQAADGYLWVGTAEGVVRFDGERFTGFPEETDAMLEKPSIRGLFPLANDEVWVTTGSALFRGKGARLEEVHFPASADGAPPAPVSQIILGDGGAVFLRRGEEIWKYLDGVLTRVAEKGAALEKLLQQDAEGELERGHFAQGRSGTKLRNPRGGLWDFKPGAGLFFTDPAGRTESISLSPELPSAVYAMMEDREGNLWLGTQTQGLWRVRPARVEMLTRQDGLSDPAVMVLLEDHTGALWVSTQAGGLDCFSAGASEVKHFEVGASSGRRPVAALLETRAGELWAATRDGQVYSWKNDGFSPAFRANHGPGRIVAMAEDERGQIWFGGHYRLSVASAGGWRAIDFGSPESVTAVATAGAVVWAGTDGGQVFRGMGERFEAAAAPEAFGRQRISSLLPDADGSLWVATVGGGLFRLQGNRVTALAPRMRAVDLRLTSVLDDGAGFLWMGTLGGICRVDKAKLLGAQSPSGAAAVVLDRSDGLLTRECTRGGQPAGWRGRDGTLFFATGNGVARVHPSQFALDTVPPPVVIEEASANGRPLSMGFGRVGPGRSRLEFRYTALTFTAPEKVRFRTQLEGLDDQWRDAGTLRTAAYNAVPPGHYRFRVIATNGDGVWSEVGATVAIVVAPYYWQTLPFKIALAVAATVLVLGIGMLISRARWRGRMLRMEAETARQAERTRIARDLHDQVGANLTQLSLLAEFAHTPEGLAELAETTREAAEALDAVVWAVDPRKDTLQSLLQYLVRVAEDFLRHAHVRCRMDVPTEVPPRGLSPEFRHHVLLIVKEALNNAAKYASAAEVTLAAHVNSETLTLAIHDDGCGFDLSTVVDGNGLKNMRERAAVLGGICKIESSRGEGTRITVTIPWSGHAISSPTQSLSK